MAELCRLCNSRVGNLLEHYRIDHGIKTPEEYQAELAKVEAAKARQREYGAFIDELNKKQAKGLITGEEWRRLAQRWREEHQMA